MVICYNSIRKQIQQQKWTLQRRFLKTTWWQKPRGWSRNILPNHSLTTNPLPHCLVTLTCGRNSVLFCMCSSHSSVLWKAKMQIQIERNGKHTLPNVHKGWLYFVSYVISFLLTLSKILFERANFATTEFWGVRAVKCPSMRRNIKDHLQPK